MKRILAIDGGGLRGMFALGVLERVEALLREARARPDLVLADEFDLFAGTSTGAIIATCLSRGMPVAAVEELYSTRGSEMFAPEPWWRRWRSKYRAEALAAMFRELFGDDALDSPRLRGILLVVMRNATTGSPWPVTNNPRAMYNDPALADCNLRIPLWRLLRASTAAPTFFPPERIELGGCEHLFVDGGVTPFNNPALLAALTATLPCYRIGWPASRDELRVISVGTGSHRARLPQKPEFALWDHVRFVIPALIGSAAWEQDLLCRVLGECVFGAPLDSEAGDLRGPSLLAPEEKKFRYVRYDENLDGRAPPALDDVSSTRLLLDLGRDYAARCVRPEHL